VHPDGQHVFCNEEAGAKITCYDWDADTGTLTPKQSLPTLPVSGRWST
jgi:6-phosphogluconolactonase (cycloisomerase 2 family)